MRLTRPLESVSAGRSAWACCLAEATITTSEVPTISNLLHGYPIFGNPADRSIQTGRSLDLMNGYREYAFYRHRYGFVGSADYKLGQGSLAYLRGLFSQFLDYAMTDSYTSGRYVYEPDHNVKRRQCGLLSRSSQASAANFQRDWRAPITV